MEPDIRWLDDPEVFQVGRLPAHSDHLFYEGEEAMERGKSGLVLSLNGTWEFHYSPNPAGRPAGFYRPDFDRTAFGEIMVPGHIELSGRARIGYINTMYPWEGHRYRRPAHSLEGSHPWQGMFSGAEDNPVGSYVKRFTLPAAWEGKRVSVCFEGVEQAMYLWLNGCFVGYSEDSFTPSEFDLTPFIRPGENVIAVEVYKQSSAVWLEDQDFFRFFGIFRDVKLYARPGVHLEDVWAKPRYNPEKGTGSLELALSFSWTTAPGTALICLLDSRGGTVWQKETAIKEKVSVLPADLGTVEPWERNNPRLYTLKVLQMNGKREMEEAAQCRVGFRKVEIRDGILRLNGRRLVLCGVNRHEWSAATGRAVTREDMEWDIACLERNHINAVRTCHYPDQIAWYHLCDAHGIYVMAETNLESHGSWQKMNLVEPSWNVPGSIPQWREAVLDRAKSNFHTFKNHPSVLIWSLGNESYAGDNIRDMQRFFKEADPERPVHYEGVYHNPAYRGEISDMESRMYAPPEEAVSYLENDSDKPYLLCEYMHCMGNSLGGMKAYMDLIERFPMYAGGFIWDFIDQALWVKDEVSGKRVLRYGGDFDERPTDYEFSGNGIVFADRTEKPAMQEVRHYYGRYDKED